MTALFTHQKLDWTIHTLGEALEASPDDGEVRMQLSRALLSKGLFHDGGESVCASALAGARKTLGEDPGNLESLGVAGLALLGMGRPEAAWRYLRQGLAADGDAVEIHLGLGWHATEERDTASALRHLEAACRLAPESWETHLWLGRTLLRIARTQKDAERLLERAQYHLVQCLRLGPPPAQTPPLLRDLGVSCLQSGRLREAERFFIRLREQDDYAPIARFHLGQVAYGLGKYHNAITHFRQFLRDNPEDPDVLARMALTWFQLGDYRRARETCHQALLADPTHVPARHALGCALLEEGDANEALKTFRQTLKESPGHLPSYIELARARRLGGDVPWLIRALEVEVGQYDRLPRGKTGSEGAQVEPRAMTRERIRVVLEELRAVGPSTTDAVLRTIHHTQDEGLRFQLWEAACAMATSAVADETAGMLRQSGVRFSPALGAEALAASSALPEPVLTSGLRVEDSDLKRAAIDRHPPAHDVIEHRRNLDRERQRARAYQALLLLAVASRRSPAGRQLLREWASAADPELATAAWAGLALYGEPEASAHLQRRARDVGVPGIVERLLREVSPAERRLPPRRVSDDEQTTCTTCGRTPDEVSHMITGGDTVICDRCVGRVSTERAKLRAPDEAHCQLCGRSHFESRGVYRFQSVDICHHCLQLSLGLVEREEVAQFLATW